MPGVRAVREGIRTSIAGLEPYRADDRFKAKKERRDVETTEPWWTQEDVCVGIWDVDTGKVLGKKYFPGKSVIGLPSIRANSASAYILRTSGDIIEWDVDQDRLVKWAGTRSIPSQRRNEQWFVVAERTAYVVTTSGRSIVLMKGRLRSASDAK